MERKLAAILCADVAGYSRLMGQNEVATLATLTAHRRIIDSLIEQRRGRFVNSAGDSVLAEFASVVNAVECAIAIQTVLQAENESAPPERRMEFRIGVNLGEVMVEGEQIYGDGVNVAARLESLAEPGGICISAKVHDEVAGKLDLNYQDLGAQRVKNIAEPVRAWRVIPGALSPRPTRRITRKYWQAGVFSLAGLAIMAATIIVVQHVSLRPPPSHASIPPQQKPALSLPDKPSIAVLPFTNMSGDREQEYFSDGITDDLITDLSRLPDLFVIARESSFTYKGKAAKVQEVGRELGVKYVLGGGVRRAAGQVRITVQLADATTGEELWAERYDRPLRDVFALQDEIVRRIVTTLNLQIELAQQGMMVPRRTDNLEAYDDLLRGVVFSNQNSRDGNAKAREMFEKAIELDPKYADAYANFAGNYYMGWVLALNPDRTANDHAQYLAQQALKLDDSLPLAHNVLAYIDVQEGQLDHALTEAQRVIALDPNSAAGYSALAEVLSIKGKADEALAAIEKAMRLDPRSTSNNYLWQQGRAYSQLGRWEEGIAALKRAPDWIWCHEWLAIDYFNLGDRDAARAETAQVEKAVALAPDYGVAYWALAMTLDGQGRPVEALAAAEKAVALGSQDSFFLLTRGILYNELGRWEESAVDLKRYLAVDPNNFWGHALLADDYAALGHEDAVGIQAAEVERILTLEPDSSTWAPAIMALAITRYAEGKQAEALAALEKGMRLDSRHRVDYLWLEGGIYTDMARWEEAISPLKDYLAHYRNQVGAHVDLAIDYVEVGRDDDARAEMAEAVRLYPQFSLNTTVEGLSHLYHMDKERVAADLRTAGLKWDSEQKTD
jgi:adenylate cyclase